MDNYFEFTEPLSYLEFLRVIGNCVNQDYEIVDFDFEDKDVLKKDKVDFDKLWHDPYYLIGFTVTHCEELEWVDIRSRYGVICLYPNSICGDISYEEAKKFVEEMKEGTKMHLKMIW